MYAIWNDTTAPSLSLSKQGTVNGFKGWYLPNASITSDNVLEMNTATTVQSPYYDVSGNSWYYTWDAYTSTAVSGASSGGFHTGTGYYDSSFKSYVSSNSYSGNGYADDDSCQSECTSQYK